MDRDAAAEPPTAVVLRALKLGDLLTALPALRALREALPDHRRLLAAPRRLAPLVRLLDVGHRVVDTAEEGALRPSLRWPALAVNLHGSGPESTARLMALEPRHLISFGVTSAWCAEEHERERWCRLLSESSIPADPTDLHVDPPPCRRQSWKGVTVVHPGASARARRWPVERWSRIAAHEMASGHRVLLTGDSSEAVLVHEVARRAGLPPASVLAGRTSLRDLVTLVGAAALVVCGDTGIAHVSYATSTPSVVLFGPTPPDLWGPPPGPHIALWTGLRGDPHANKVHSGLLDIAVGDVVDAIAALRGALGPQVS